MLGDSGLGQGNDGALAVEIFDRRMGGVAERGGVGEGPMGQVLHPRPCQTASVSLSSGA